jgi:hypothetical protein
MEGPSRRDGSVVITIPKLVTAAAAARHTAGFPEHIVDPGLSLPVELEIDRFQHDTHDASTSAGQRASSVAAGMPDQPQPAGVALPVPIDVKQDLAWWQQVDLQHDNGLEVEDSGLDMGTVSKSRNAASGYFERGVYVRY